MDNPQTIVEVTRVGTAVASPRLNYEKHIRRSQKSVSVTHGLRQQSRFHKRYRKQADEYDKKRHGGPNPTSTCDAECRSRFYEVYHKQSQEYDREFAKKYDDDLDTTLIFAGLFSAVASAFIASIQPDMQPDYGQQTVEILKTLVRAVNNPTPDAVPEFPQWTGPPQTIVQVQSILYSSLCTALFSAFLAMLGKQWLNRYVVGSIADRSHHRQRKLDGMVTWYFDIFMEILPLMLQLALLLLGTALSLYLWGLQPTVSRVVIGITSLGVVLYLFLVIAGSLYPSCPYQTPASQTARHMWERLIPNLIKGLRHSIHESYSLGAVWHRQDGWGWISFRLLFLPVILVADCYCIVKYLAIRLFRSMKASILYLLRSIRRDNRTSRTLDAGGRTAQEAALYILDFHCIAWILDTSLVKTVHVIALEFLATLPISHDTNPAVIVRCLDLLFSCIDVDSSNRAVILSGSEALANAAATAFLHILVQLHRVDPGLLDDFCERYRSRFSKDITFHQRPATVMTILHFCLYDMSHRAFPSWGGYRLSPLTHEAVSKALVVRSRQQCDVLKKVPRWVLRFVLHSLSQRTLPSDVVVSCCLRIVSNDLGGTTIEDESAELSIIINHVISHINVAGDLAVKSVTSIFVYAVRKAEDGDPRLLNEVLLVARRFPQHSGWVRRHISPITGRMLSEPGFEICKHAVVRALPCLEDAWFHTGDKTRFVKRWLSAAAHLKYTQEIGQSVVEVLLRMACVYQWRQHITPEAWEWLKRRPQLPPVCRARSLCCSDLGAISAMQTLKNIELLKAYLVVVWSEWDWVAPWVCSHMCTVIRKSFGGEEMKGHRDELRSRLRSVRERLDLGLNHLRKQGSKMSAADFQPTKEAYEALAETLLEMDSPPSPRILRNSHPNGASDLVHPPATTSQP